MADIKRQDLTLQDWTKGISADEFAGGSYFYAEGIQTGYNTKGFKLGHRLDSEVLNYRGDGYPVALSPSGYYGITAFTHDSRIETQEFYNGSLNGDGDMDGGGALFANMPNITSKRVNGVTYGTKAIGIRQSYIDVVDTDGLFNPANELLTNTHLSDNAGWTVGTGWTITSEGAVHESGTAALSANITTTDYSRVRVAIKIKNRTSGRITVGVGGGTTEQASSNGWWVRYAIANTGESLPVTITPTNDFDGTIEIVNVHEVNTDKLGISKSEISPSDTHPCVIRGGELYIGSGNKVDVVNLNDWGVITKSLVDENETIVDIVQQAGNLIIWATDGFNSRQYYWNGVDSIASEAIEWKGLIIKAVVNTETVCYVLTTSGATTGSVYGYQYRLYAVSGYQRSLLANKSYFPNSQDNLDQEQYNFQKKFDFNDVSSSKSMCMFLDSLYVPGCDGIYKYGNDIPGMRTVWSRPIRYPLGANKIILGQRGVYFCIAYTLDGINYIGQINEQRYLNNGYLVTEGIYRDKLGTRKNIEKLKIGYKNVASEDGNIKVYAIVDDDYFWRFKVDGITNRPTVGAVYNVANQTTAEVINVDKDNNLITFRTIENLGSYLGQSNTTLTKVSGEGDDSITTEGYDNMCLIKTIESEKQGYGSDLIFGKDFVNNYMPYWYKLQLVIELNSIDSKLTPEIYEISINSDITDIVL